MLKAKLNDNPQKPCEKDVYKAVQLVKQFQTTSDACALDPFYVLNFFEKYYSQQNWELPDSGDFGIYD